MSDTDNARNPHTLLELIKTIWSTRETGILEISVLGTRGALSFIDGRLFDARLGSLNGFQAVNAAVSMHDAQFAFSPSSAPGGSSSITSNERIVLKRFFGIESVNDESVKDVDEGLIDWDLTPEQVVPLSEVKEITNEGPDDTPTIEAEPVIASAKREGAWLHSAVEAGSAENGEITARDFPLGRRPRLGLYVALALALMAGAIALSPKLTERVLPATETIESESLRDREEKKVTGQENVAHASLSPSATGAAEQSHQAEEQKAAQNLSGEWRVVNRVEKTAYRSFDNLEIGFRLVINQNGNEFTATGEKVSENGRSLRPRERTPIYMTGSVDGDKVIATFVEEGAFRKTSGRFVWRILSDRGALTGTFVSSAARSSGNSSATKQL